MIFKSVLWTGEGEESWPDLWSVMFGGCCLYLIFISIKNNFVFQNKIWKKIPVTAFLHVIKVVKYYVHKGHYALAGVEGWISVTGFPSPLCLWMKHMLT